MSTVSWRMCPSPAFEARIGAKNTLKLGPAQKTPKAKTERRAEVTPRLSNVSCQLAELASLRVGGHEDKKV